ncbi:hypothetical protein D3C86_1780900 [compost metagenome]
MHDTLALFRHRNMSMTVNQHIASRKRRQIVRAKKMPVGQKQTTLFQQDLLPGCGYREMQ